jgi:hypothetical protein
MEMDHRSASHLAVHMLDGATMAHGLSDSPAGLLAWLLERWNAWSDDRSPIVQAPVGLTFVAYENPPGRTPTPG